MPDFFSMSSDYNKTVISICIENIIYNTPIITDNIYFRKLLCINKPCFIARIIKRLIINSPSLMRIHKHSLKSPLLFFCKFRVTKNVLPFSHAKRFPINISRLFHIGILYIYLFFSYIHIIYDILTCP